MVRLRGTWKSGTTFKKSIDAIQNDYGGTIHFQMQDDCGSGLYLTVDPALFIGNPYVAARRASDSTNLISGVGEIIDGDIGTVDYTIKSGDLVNKGKYHVQVSVQRSGHETTCNGFYIYIREDYAPR